jgi:hypothetical protein
MAVPSATLRHRPRLRSGRTQAPHRTPVIPDGEAFNLGMIFIWMQDINADTIVIDNTFDNIANLPDRMVLFKIKK